MSYEQLADREWAREAGRCNPDSARVLSDRDVWYPNPFYAGPRVPHPEDAAAPDFIEEYGIEAWRAHVSRPAPVPPADDIDWDALIPF
ncbi:hypothetical protein [Kozakia baliensis]|uniref:Uncharacterized protein n=1 Tax=Kozakia baliensis TaxID=153496 RepID=A0A1D8UYB4_9PROT|nr:hypothetical protein [Kozakia baliensis]AOX18578.1 hypothetical protein A0U89_14925 [Kozakia baliensis]AOX18614.1 hypothetical protein A0U89_14980 [Kozakia baliensis]GBR35237.1 hypothetical protein AA0488_2936 [Kozakia baliensis NRIC 0488]GEL65745.1 hypothetical protein KBA01_30310 [Kozakia baliensis]